MLLIIVEKKIINDITTIDPRKAPRSIDRNEEMLNERAESAAPPVSITSATPRLAPELIPKIEGPARGLLNTVCNISPLAASDAPQSMAVIACGNLDSQIIYVQLLFSAPLPQSISHTASAGIFTEPKRRLAATRIMMSSDNRMQYFNPLYPNLFC